MSKRNISIPASMLAVLSLLASALAGCGNAQQPVESDVTSDSAAVETPTQEVSETAEVSGLPDEYDLEGYEFRVIKQRQDKILWSLNTFGVNEENGDVLNDTFYKRNSEMMEKYNFKITETEIYSSPVEIVRSTVLAGDDAYDVALIQFINELASNDGTYMNLHELPNLDLERSWWNQDLISNLTINDSLYFISGDIMVSDDDGLIINIVSKPLVDEYKLGNLYDVVRDGKWTYDYKLGLMKQVSADLNSDGVYDTDDRLGMLYAGNSVTEYFASMNTYLFSQNESGINFTGNSERAYSVFEKLQKMLTDKTIAYPWINIKQNSSETIVGLLDSKQVLFLDIGLHFVRRNLRDLETDYGILPMPKLDEAQDKYYNIISGAMTSIFVPASIQNPEKTGFVLEALASASGDITNTYYKTCIEGKYVRDEESIEMLNIASENIVFDLGFIYNWGNLGTAIKNGAMNDSASYASLLASYESSAVEEMKKYFEK